MNFREMERTFIVAEIGVNHEGDLETAASLIRHAARAGVDAVKFQAYQINNYISRSQPERYERSQRFQLSYEQFTTLSHVASECGVIFFASAFGLADVDFLSGLAPLLKISSGDLTYHRLLAHAASTGKPIILSTGGATLEELDAAVDVLRANGPKRPLAEWLLLNQCTACYPAPPEEINLRAMNFLSQRYGVSVGYSDHTLGTAACIAAVALGARAIEKHFTDHRADRTFHDHALSSEPAEMAQLVQDIRAVEAALGADVKARTACEESTLPRLRRGLAASRDLPSGHVVDAADLAYLRPAGAFPAGSEQRLIGRKLRRSIAAGYLFTEEDLD